MKNEVYFKIEKSENTGYISISDIIPIENIKNSYEKSRESILSFGGNKPVKMELLEGYKLQYIKLNVKFDGRKKVMSVEDILRQLEEQNMVYSVGDSVFGGYYLPTKSLSKLLEIQLNKRKELVNDGKYTLIGNGVIQKTRGGVSNE